MRTAACHCFHLLVLSPRSGCLSRAFANIMAAREQWHPLTSQSSTASTPNSDFLGDFASPSRMNLPTRKRSHSKHLDGQLAPFEDNKSRRTSMSPFGTGPPTPSTLSSGYGYPMIGDGYFDLTVFVHKFTTAPLHLYAQPLPPACINID